MAIPWNICGSASQLFFQDKASPQYEALLAIANVPHPDRSILASFINDAVDPPEAARYFLRMTCTGDSSKVSPEKMVSQFLSEWKILIEKFRPTPANSLSSETKIFVYERDGRCCCLTRTPFKSYLDCNLEYVHIVSPHVFTDPALSEGIREAALYEMLGAFLSKELLEAVRSIFSGPGHKQLEGIDNIWLLSTQAFDAMQNGEVFFTVQSWANNPDTTRSQTYNVDTNTFTLQINARLSLSTDTMHLENRTRQLTSLPNEQLLGIHARFSKSLAWMDAKKYIEMPCDDASRKERLFPSLASPLFRLCRQLWVALPSFVRRSVYDGLIWIGSRIYGRSLSMTVYKLPFGLYLRRGSVDLAPNYHVEAHTLHMVEQFTQIPAPRAIDVLESSRFSYLLMTCVPGRPIGHIFNTMTDEQVKQVVTDLKGYISELRAVPKKAAEYHICNSQGGGILDWRIPDSQREELRFKTEADFNKYLTDPFWEDIRMRASKSHDIPHDIVFTHGDLNPRNILAENGKIMGIVDWENAGWFPEYWEYTKAHYSVRSLMRWLADVVDRVFEGYRDELVVENMLSDLLGPF